MTQAWWEDDETAQRVMAIFNRYKHAWRKVGSQHEALCTRFLHAGPLPNEEGKPPCPGCVKKGGRL